MKFSLIKGLVARARTLLQACYPNAVVPNTYTTRIAPSTFGTSQCLQPSGFAQNKVLVIMEHRIFQKQAYLDTGNQKITELLLRPVHQHPWPCRNEVKTPACRYLLAPARPPNPDHFFNRVPASQAATPRLHFMIGSGHSEGCFACVVAMLTALPPLKASSPGKGEIS